MSLKKIYSSKIFEIFSFIRDEYGFDFEIIDDYLIIAKKQDMNLYFIFDRGLFFSVEIEVTGNLGERAINNRKYRKLGASTMAECIDREYEVYVKQIKNEADLIKEMKEEARVLRKYCGNILSGDVSDWERIVNCLLKG
jgi:hypothetical protein